jgi:hypothetical protein
MPAANGNSQKASFLMRAKSYFDGVMVPSRGSSRNNLLSCRQHCLTILAIFPSGLPKIIFGESVASAALAGPEHGRTIPLPDIGLHASQSDDF